MVTFIFWTLLYPFLGKEYLVWRTITTHGGACVLILGDFFLNNILTEKRHSVYILGIMIFYSIEMVTVKYTLGWVLYFFATLDSPISWILTLMVGTTFSGAHLILAMISTCLHSKNMANTQVASKH